MLSLASLTVVIAGMAAINDNVRNAIGDILGGRVPNGIHVPAVRFEHLARFTDVFGLPGGSQAPLFVFGLAALVLFILMFRM